MKLKESEDFVSLPVVSVTGGPRTVDRGRLR